MGFLNSLKLYAMNGIGFAELRIDIDIIVVFFSFDCLFYLGVRDEQHISI